MNIDHFLSDSNEWTPKFMKPQKKFLKANSERLLSRSCWKVKWKIDWPGKNHTISLARKSSALEESDMLCLPGFRYEKIKCITIEGSLMDRYGCLSCNILGYFHYVIRIAQQLKQYVERSQHVDQCRLIDVKCVSISSTWKLSKL